MPVITIPFDYDPQKYDEVPIFLNDTDDDGDKIFFGWIEAVVPVQDKLRSLARRVLQDVWRVSELTDVTLRYLWRTHRENLGPHPSFRVYRSANKQAHHLEDPGARVHCQLNFSLDWLDEYQLDSLVETDYGTESQLQRNLDLDRFESKLKQQGSRTELEVYRLLRAGYYWREIGPKVGERPNTIFRRFRRQILGIADIV